MSPTRLFHWTLGTGASIQPTILDPDRSCSTIHTARIQGKSNADPLLLRWLLLLLLLKLAVTLQLCLFPLWLRSSLLSHLLQMLLYQRHLYPLEILKKKFLHDQKQVKEIKRYDSCTCNDTVAL